MRRCSVRDMDVHRNQADAEYARGVQLRQENRLVEALSCYERAVALAPEHARSHNNIGVIRQQSGEPASAEAAYRKAVEADPQFGLAWFNLGNCFRQDNRLPEAQATYRRALELMPDDAETRINLAIVLRELRQFDESLAVLGEILPTSSDHAKARFNTGLIHLLRGELGKGWDEYESRLAIDTDVRSIAAQLRWDGSPLGTRSIMVFSEQGIGDQVMFASCLPDLVSGASLRDAAQIHAECDHRLVPLFARSFPRMTLLPKMASSGAAFDWPLRNRRARRVAAALLAAAHRGFSENDWISSDRRGTSREVAVVVRSRGRGT